jgi:hypothetical protein
MVPIIVGRRMGALLLCGAHVNGAGLNAEETRWIRGLAADASLVYGASTTPNWDNGEFSRQLKRC